MTTRDKIDFSTSKHCCNDAVKNTWDVQAFDGDKWWIVSESTEMNESDAADLAESMRRGEE